MKETATVLKINGPEILVQFHEQEGCKTCNSMFCKANERIFTAANSRNLPLQPGDIVTVYLPAGKTVQATFLLLIAPLILFILFFMLSERVFGIHHDLAKIGIGLVGLCIGFLISFLLNRRKKLSDMAQIIEKNDLAD